MERYRKDSSRFKYPDNRILAIDTQDSIEIEPVWCSLSPACAPPNEPRRIHTFQDLHTHYASFHGFACPEEGCSCLFNSEHFLRLHVMEIHDADALRRKEAGQAIHRCLLTDCSLVFISPNQRRKHLLTNHGFEHNFFFSVIKYGIGGQLRAWAKQTPESQSLEQPHSRTPRATALSPMRDKSEPRHHIHGQTRPSKPPFDLSRTPDYHESTMACLAQPVSKDRNASTPYTDGTILDLEVDSATPEGEMEDAGDLNPERVGVRFAEEVAVRVLSPIDHRHGRFVTPRGSSGGVAGNGRRRGRPPTRGGANHYSRHTGPAGKMYGDSETSARPDIGDEYRQSGFRGRAQAQTRPATDRQQQRHF